MDIENRLNETIADAYRHMIDCIGSENGIVSVVDPVDGKRVPGHYGETHLCAAMLFAARRNADPVMKAKALELLEGILAHWDEDSRAAEAHRDFNNFALALMIRDVRDEDPILAKRLAGVLSESADSANRTVNWLPMRAYAMLTRYECTGTETCLKSAADLLQTVSTARYTDGLYDDLLPKGESFNLQYCISTAAELALIGCDFPEVYDKLPHDDLEATMRTLYSLVLPDGDINYMGRGCNQLFAWGPWLLLMKAFECTGRSEASLSFLSSRLAASVDGNNLLLNGCPGAERGLWWDYHHFSVYMSHLLLWYELSLRVKNKCRLDSRQLTTPKDSGMHVERNDSFMFVTFAGRKHYLVEKGPAAVALWTRSNGVMFKCGHGPAAGMFSKKNFNVLNAYLDHFGLVAVEETPKRIANKLLRKLYFMFVKPESGVNIKPRFQAMNVKLEENVLTLSVEHTRNEKCCMVIPVLSGAAGQITVTADQAEQRLHRIGQTETQYGMADLYATQPVNAAKWTIRITEVSVG